jgi:hypothetical protein
VEAIGPIAERRLPLDKVLAAERYRERCRVCPHETREMVIDAPARSNRGAANLVTGAVRVYRSVDFMPTGG